MSSWTTHRISPFTAYLVILTTLAIAVAVALVLFVRGQPPGGKRGVMPFPPSQSDFYRLDEVAGHLHQPDVERTVGWPEHPGGRFTLRTNNLGFREDSPTATGTAPGVTRILVTGDSHIDGVVDNAESFPNLLERMLNDAPGTASCEVINAGTGHYGPFNYLGALDRWAELAPQDYVVVLYLGNDLLDAVAEAWVRGTLEIPERPADYMERLERARRLSDAGVSQCLNQVYLLKTFPELAERSVAITGDVLGRIADRCHELDARLFVVLLPAPYEVQSELGPGFADAVAVLGLTADDLAGTRRLAVALSAILSSRSIAVLDPLPEFAAAGRPLYWLRDLHLNVAGHRLLAELFFNRFCDELERTAARDR